MSNSTSSSSSPIHYVIKYTFGGGIWGTYWLIAFVVNPNDTVSMFAYRNGLTGNKANLDRLLAYPIVDKTTGWNHVATGERVKMRGLYKKVLGDGYKPVNP